MTRLRPTARRSAAISARREPFVGHREAAQAVDPGEHAEQLGEAAPDSRLATGEADLLGSVRRRRRERGG